MRLARFIRSGTDLAGLENSALTRSTARSVPPPSGEFGPRGQAAPRVRHRERSVAIRGAEGDRAAREGAPGRCGFDPGVRRRRALVPDVQRRADENELMGLAARSAAQSVFVPVDPNVPPFVLGERELQTFPSALHPLRGAPRPEAEVRQLAYAELFQRRGIEAHLLPNGPIGGGPRGRKRGARGAGEGDREGGGKGGGVSGVGGGS